MVGGSCTIGGQRRALADVPVDSKRVYIRHLRFCYIFRRVVFYLLCGARMVDSQILVVAWRDTLFWRRALVFMHRQQARKRYYPADFGRPCVQPYYELLRHRAERRTGFIAPAPD